MKKTLIALTIAASAAVSGSAMAADWVQNGTGGSVDMGGTLTPADAVTPWEVKTGDPVTNLDGHIKKGLRTANIAVNNAIPVLGIRTQSRDAFVGAPGIAPNIDYKGAIDVATFADGVTALSLTVNDKDSGNKIGTLTTDLTAGAMYSWKKINEDRGDSFGLHSINQTNQLFNGGLSSKSGGSMTPADLLAKANVIFPGSMDNYTNQGFEPTYNYWSGVEDDETTHSAFYASGIEAGKIIKITLDNQVTGDAQINWKASLPVTVSYQ
ncbi:hypothetical protein AB9E48_00645 [Escherichia coli]|uniref:F4 family fimbrial subunit n=1 Tax=Escherichia coli TaxID=562 RepID=UPI0038B611E6